MTGSTAGHRAAVGTDPGAFGRALGRAERCSVPGPVGALQRGSGSTTAQAAGGLLRGGGVWWVGGSKGGWGSGSRPNPPGVAELLEAPKKIFGLN